jgi:hypothetical protein
MYLSEMLHIWRRRLILTAVLIIAASIGTTAALMKLPRTYQSTASVVLLASRSAARQTGGNPFLNFSPSLTLTADVLSRELMDPSIALGLAASGFPAAYTVALAPNTTSTTGSVLLITVTGNDSNAVESTLRAVTAEISKELSTLQRNVARHNRIRAATISFSPQATLSVSQTARGVVLVVLPGLLAALGIPILVDRRAIRRARRKAVLPAQAVLPEQNGPAATEGIPANYGHGAGELPESGTSSFELTHPYGGP